jgi:hypothetical protein
MLGLEESNHGATRAIWPMSVSKPVTTSKQPPTDSVRRKGSSIPLTVLVMEEAALVLAHLLLLLSVPSPAIPGCLPFPPDMGAGCLF